MENVTLLTNTTEPAAPAAGPSPAPPALTRMTSRTGDVTDSRAADLANPGNRRRANDRPVDNSRRGWFSDFGGKGNVMIQPCIAPILVMEMPSVKS